MKVYVILKTVWEQHTFETHGEPKTVTYSRTSVGDVWMDRKMAIDSLFADGFYVGSPEWSDSDYERRARVDDPSKWDGADIMEREVL